MAIQNVMSGYPVNLGVGLGTQIVYNTYGTYLYTVPQGIYKISALCVGGGGIGGCGYNSSGGGGGGTNYFNNYAVTPGTVLQIEVGYGGTAYFPDGTASLLRLGQNGTILLSAGGGRRGANAALGTAIASGGAGGTTSGLSGTTGYSGGAGGGTNGYSGGGGGGAGGYAGNGGVGGKATTTSGPTIPGVTGGNGTGGAAGGGGGGVYYVYNSASYYWTGGSGGGIGLLGQGTNGVGGTSPGNFFGNGGGGGSGGDSAVPGVNHSGGGLYGGGGSASINPLIAGYGYGCPGANGAVRIILQPSNGTRSYPSNAADV